MTWKDIKLATLQKMFSGNDGADNEEYIAAMPYVANEALAMLATAGRYLIKETTITHDGTNKAYNLKTITGDYYDIDRIVYENNDSYGEYFNYKLENGTLVFRGLPAGSYRVYYKAYPPEITTETQDNYVLPVPMEVAVLIPLYMASQLYKEDDNSIATIYRNEFEIGFERLSKNVTDGSNEFVSESGWI